MTISQALSNAASGLTAAAQRASITSNNIANALTEGYARRNVELAERVTAGVGAGVGVAGVARAENTAITYERRLADNEFARDTAIATALNEAARLVGDSDAPNALFEKYAKFERSIRALADAPDSAAAQSVVVNAAKDLANGFARVAEGFQSVRTRADREIAASVSSINDNLASIKRLNLAISRGSNSGSDINALIDQRARLVDQINTQIPVREIPRDGGQIDLVTPEGVFLIAGSTIRELEFTPSPTVDAQTTYANGAGALSGLTIGGVDVTPGGSGAQAIVSGALAGQFTVRDSTIPQASRALDALALDLAERFSDPAVDPTIALGAPGLFTDNGSLASPATITGLASRLQLNPSTDPAQGGESRRLRDGLGSAVAGPAGDDTLIRSLITALETPRTTNPDLRASRDLSAADAAAQLTSILFADRNDAASRADAASGFVTTLRESEQQATGVDTDQELQQLLLIEQAYGANARVIETIDRLMQRLLEI